MLKPEVICMQKALVIIPSRGIIIIIIIMLKW